jgi:hypothetical protein
MEEIKDGKSLVQLGSDELFFINNSIIGSSTYKKSEETMEEPITVTHDVPYWKQRVDCKFCGNNVSRSYYAQHRRSKRCQIYQDMNQKIRDLVLKS